MIDFIKRVFGLIVPYWKTKSSILSWVLLISVLFLTAAVVYLNKLFNNWYNEFYNTMQAVDESGFKRCLVLFAVLACFWVLSNSCKSFFTQIFEIRWRHWMTRSFMARWLKTRLSTASSSRRPTRTTRISEFPRTLTSSSRSP